MMVGTMIIPENRVQRLRRSWGESMRWTKRHVPPGVRTLVGLLLVVAGVFGFLPVLGFWMIPLGAAVILLDLRALYRFVRQGLQNRTR
jgi:hypothetical protein